MDFSSKLLLAKIETTEGVDAGATAAANAIETTGLNITPLEADKSQNERDQAFSGNSVQRLRSKRARVSAPTYGTPSGVLGTAPGISPLLRCSGLAETINVGTSVVYTKVLEGHESATLAPYHGEIGQIITAFRSDLTVTLAAGSDPRFAFEGLGNYASPTEVAIPTPDFSAFGSPIEVGKDNTTITVHGFTINCDNFEWRLGNQLSYINRTEQKGSKIAKPAPAATARFVLPKISVKDFFALVEAEATDVVTVTHGTVAGNIIELSFPAAQLLEPSLENMDDDLGVSLPINPIPDGTGIDFTLTYK